MLCSKLTNDRIVEWRSVLDEYYASDHKLSLVAKVTDLGLVLCPDVPIQANSSYLE